MTSSLPPSLPQFIQALQDGSQIDMNQQGEWKRIGMGLCDFAQRITRSALHTLSLAPSFDSLLAESYLMQLKGWDFDAVDLSAYEQLQLLEQGHELLKSRLADVSRDQANEIRLCKDRLKTAKIVSEGQTLLIQNLRSKLLSTKKEAKDFFTLQRIDQEITRLSLLQEPLSTHEARADTTALPSWFEKKLIKWVKLSKIENFSLQAASTQAKLARFCCYTPFIETLKGDRESIYRLFTEVFRKWAEQSVAGVDCAILLPKARRWLAETFMDERIRYYNDNSVQVLCQESVNSNPKYSVLVPIEGQLVDITNPRISLCFRSVDSVVNRPIEQLRLELLKQNDHLIDYEFIQNKGISFIDCSLRTMNFEQPAWWKQLPLVEEVTRQEMKERFNCDCADASNTYAFYGLCASRKNRDLSVQETHGNLMIGIPLDNGKFNLIYPGKYAKIWPQGVKDLITFIFKTHIAQLTYIDPNRTMNSRQQIQVCTGLTQAAFEKAMSVLAKYFTLARQESLIFQPQGDNCANFAFEVTKEIFGDDLPEIFKLHFLKGKVAFPVSLIPGANRCCPTVSAWNIFRKIISYPLGALQTLTLPTGEQVRLTHSKNWQEGYSTLPAQLFNTHQQLREYFSAYQNRASS